MMKALVPVVALTLFPAIPVFGSGIESYSWSNGALAPLQRFEAQGLAHGNELYVFGGFGPGVLATDACDAYNPQTDTWRPLAVMPEAITHAGQADDGDFVYVAGGFIGDHPGGSTEHVWIYDTVADQWLAGPDLPADRGGAGLARVGRSLHFFGGATRTAGINVLTDHDEHWVLDLGPTPDPGDDATAWTAAADLPNARNHMSGIGMGGFVYAIGGQHGGDENTGNQDDVHRFDPVVGTWAPRADIPITLGHVTASTFIVNGRIVIAGGVTNGDIESRQVFQYDPLLDAWSELPELPDDRQSPVGGLIGEQIVVSGGYDGAVHVTNWVTDNLVLIADPMPALPLAAALLLALLLAAILVVNSV